jgi:hypothetical protein
MRPKARPFPPPAPRRPSPGDLPRRHEAPLHAQHLGRRALEDAAGAGRARRRRPQRRARLGLCGPTDGVGGGAAVRVSGAPAKDRQRRQYDMQQSRRPIGEPRALRTLACARRRRAARRSRRIRPAFPGARPPYMRIGSILRIVREAGRTRLQRGWRDRVGIPLAAPRPPLVHHVGAQVACTARCDRRPGSRARSTSGRSRLSKGAAEDGERRHE